MRLETGHLVTGFEADRRGSSTAVGPDGRTRLTAKIFDRTPSGWEHHSTIAAPDTASAAWGNAVAVSGDEVAVGDTDQFFDDDVRGLVHVYRWAGSAWTSAQTIKGTSWHQSPFGQRLWLSGDGLVTASQGFCDGLCTSGVWSLYRRDGATFAKVFDTSPAYNASVGVDDGRFAVGVPGSPGETQENDNTLRVLDTRGPSTVTLLDEHIPFWADGPPWVDNEGLFRKVDLSGDVLAYESCCTSDSRLHILRDDGTGYQPEATFPLGAPSAGLLVLGDLVLVLDADGPRFHSAAFDDGRWSTRNDIELPAGASFAVPPVAAGNRVAVGGDEAVHVLTVALVDDQAAVA